MRRQALSEGDVRTAARLQKENGQALSEIGRAVRCEAANASLQHTGEHVLVTPAESDEVSYATNKRNHAGPNGVVPLASRLGRSTPSGDTGRRRTWIRTRCHRSA